ncbi:hypothetical protein Dsin_012790 [Dipteronia sinensis]|uniref:Transposase-associated domain-containing protein n=1 Tax=Dipteronia sinensis TaxID=43782 RepID=A0AAE0AJK9_9ROSI|nr:hypothetical protein Dsin_012790 [Dipteronia sinensis]
MDKSWIHESRVSKTFEDGVTQFLDFAFANSTDGRIKCPCKNCNNAFRHVRNTVKEHMICDGLDIGYFSNIWIYHGELDSTQARLNNEQSVQTNDMHGMLHNAFGVLDDGDSEFDGVELSCGDHDNSSGGDENVNSGNREIPNDDAKTFYNLLKDAEQELYPGCKKFTKLSFIVRLFHIECLYGLSNKSITVLLKLFKDALPEGETLPKSFYQTKKTISDLGLGYIKIHACPNDCMLYWKEKAQQTKCTVYGTSRWKETEDDANQSSLSDRKVLAKVLRHFPLIPRLQRYFMSNKTASFLQWHERDHVKDGLLRHPADSEAWKKFDNRYPDFGSDPRNVRLGLASDGFNPFGTMSISHSTWPVILIIYNLPPWMCMKQPNFIMSLLIPGPSAPGNDIDFYLQPLLDELQELWDNALRTFDVSTNQNFNMHATLLWTISDFPTYANLSGWSTKGRFACPYCNKKTHHHRLKHLSKYCYMGHHRFLGDNALSVLSGTEIFQQMSLVKIILGKQK